MGELKARTYGRALSLLELARGQTSSWQISILCQVRASIGSIDHQTDFGYTGQRNEAYTDLMDYKARFYDVSLGRFLQPDSIISGAGNPQSFNRYSYVLNSPIKYNDPSGHETCMDDYYWHGKCHHPDKIDFSQLNNKNEKISYSGWMMYGLYIDAWQASNGNLSIKIFVTLILSHEFQPITNIGDDFKETLKTAAGNWFWCSPNGNTNNCTNLRQNGTDINASLLNWVGGMQSGRMLYEAVQGGANAWGGLHGNNNLPLATDVMNFVLNESTADGHLYLNTPFYWANRSLPLNQNIKYATQGLSFNQYFDIYPNNSVSDPFYLLSPCQTDYWRQTNTYGSCH